MTTWQPIPFNELFDLIIQTESQLMGDLERLWKLIRITPEKWQEETYGKEGGGFWVVAIFGNSVIWYNDIEEGFDIGEYSQYGQLLEYSGGQNQLIDLLKIVHGQITFPA
jgi:hypothetical protein